METQTLTAPFPRRLPCVPVIALTLAAVAWISLFSGYESFSVPFEVIWPFSPIGLLTSFKPELLDILNQSAFAGKFGYHWDYLRVFLKTCALEAVFYYFIFRRYGLLEFCAGLLVANALTHPIVFFVFPALFERYLVSALASEFFAAFAEMAFVYVVCKTLSRGRIGSFSWEPLGAVLLALGANLFSWQLGIFV